MHASKVLVAIAVSLLVACAADVPAHEIRIDSDCNGTERTGWFRFEDFDFETTCSGGGWGDCYRDWIEGVQVAGDLEVESVRLSGYESLGDREYRARFTHAEGDSAPDYYDVDYAECFWLVADGEAPGERRSCNWSSLGCSADLAISD